MADITNAERIFSDITSTLSQKNKDVAPGKMMSSPAIVYKKKVFAFFYNDKMVFRLGREFDMAAKGISKFEYLNPFKNKPPMLDWFEIEESDRSKWLDLANAALDKIRG